MSMNEIKSHPVHNFSHSMMKNTSFSSNYQHSKDVEDDPIDSILDEVQQLDGDASLSKLVYFHNSNPPFRELASQKEESKALSSPDSENSHPKKQFRSHDEGGDDASVESDQASTEAIAAQQKPSQVHSQHFSTNQPPSNKTTAAANGSSLKSNLGTFQSRHTTIPIEKSSTVILNRSISIDELRNYFHLPLVEVAKQFGTCTTALKKVCRRLNITKWPYRQILSLTKSIQSLEMAALTEGVGANQQHQYRHQIFLLQKAINEIIKNPSNTIESIQQQLEYNSNVIDEAMLIAEQVSLIGSNNNNHNHHHNNNNNGNNNNSSNNSNGLLSSATKNSFTNNTSQENTASSSQHGKIHTTTTLEHDEIRQIVEAATAQVGKMEGTGEGYSEEKVSLPGLANGTSISAKGAAKRNMDFDSPVEDRNERKRSRSEDDDNSFLEYMNNELTSRTFSENTISGVADNEKPLSVEPSAANGNNSTVSSNVVSGATSRHIELPKSNGTAILNQLVRSEHVVAHAWSQYLVDVGETSVQINYNPETHKYHFTGQVHLAPLHRKKFRPNPTRKVVPLMEPDVGTNCSIDFFPTLTIPK